MRALLLGTMLTTAAHAQADADVPVAAEDYIVGSWELYKTRFVLPEGRVVDDANGSVSHSEGQGYGMLIAVAADDRVTFDLLWKWTEKNLLVRGDGLAAWKWDPSSSPHVADHNNASDGDLLIAWALTRASRQWGDPALRRRAASMIEALARSSVIDTKFGKVLLPAAKGFAADAQKDGPVVNLSYWVFPALEELAPLSSSFPAADLIGSGLSLLTALADRGFATAPEWTSLSGPQPVPAENFRAESGYNAVRIPLYLAWHSAGYGRLLAPYADAWNTSAGPAVIDLASGQATGKMAGPGYRAIGAVIQCSTDPNASAATAMHFVPTEYYSSTLQILSQMALAERYKPCILNTPLLSQPSASSQ